MISVIVPVYNEEKNVPLFYEKVLPVLNSLTYDWELLFVNDGSCDKSIVELEKLEKNDSRVRVIDFSRNFGKEMAMTAGINFCHGVACIILDADLQHPIEKIPEFIERWEGGAEVVIGIRKKNKGEGLVKKVGSYLFYKLINQISEMKIVTRATDYRLLDRVVIDEFNLFTERNRMTRALVDWLGFRREYIYFEANERIYGVPAYNFWKLLRLAFNSIISFSLLPLRLAGYLGAFITLFSGVAGFYILLGKYFFHTHFASTFSDSENLAILIVFLVGIILISIGLLALYIANIHVEVENRPLYIIRKTKKK